MIADAIENFGDQAEFETFNLECPLEDQNLIKHDKFERITSVYCIHWVTNQAQAFRTIHEMLTPGGIAFATFLSQSPLYEAYRAIAKMEKYKQHMYDVEDHIPMYHGPNLTKEQQYEILRKIMVGVGFDRANIEIDNLDIVLNHDEEKFKSE